MNQNKFNIDKQKFPLVISEKLERKIRVLCNKFPVNEWSGILFYTYTGSFKNNDIAFRAEDFLFKDTGSSGSTEFYLDEGNTAEYIANHELWDCQMGLIHSHNQMPAFFSGTDDEALAQEGMNRNHFLSLVVNNSGNYVARVTLKEIHDYVLKDICYYKTYNDVRCEKEVVEQNETSTYITLYDLDVSKEYNLTCDDYDELMDTIKQCDAIKIERIERDRKKAEERLNKNSKGSESKMYCHPKNSEINLHEYFFPKKNNKNVVSKDSQQPKQFAKTSEKIVKNNLPPIKTYTNSLSKDRIEWYTAQIISLSFIHTSVDGIDKFLDKMEDIMNNRFMTISEYMESVSAICDYLFEVELISEVDVYEESNDVHCDTIRAIYTYIHGLKSNKYIEALLNYIFKNFSYAFECE